jgi:fructokinase
VAFLGRLSLDPFGRLLEARLAESGVDRRYVLHGPAPTPLALVHASGDSDHTFSFYLAETAYADVTLDDLPSLEGGVAALYLGTLSLATDPPATAFEDLMARESSNRLVAVDPNIRAGACGDHGAYVRRFESWADHAHVIKLSGADSDWLYPGVAYETVAETILARGTQLVVLTLGPEGAIARASAARAQIAAHHIDVVDTVGAGDAFGAGLLFGLWKTGRLDARTVGLMDDEELTDLLTVASAVAALQCSRAGASPPTVGEVERFLAAP